MAYSTVKTFGRKSSKIVPLKIGNSTLHTAESKQSASLLMDNTGGSNVHVDKLRIHSVEKKWESFFRQDPNDYTLEQSGQASFEANYFIQNLRRSLASSRNLIPFGSVASDTLSVTGERRSKLLHSLMKNLKQDFSMAASNFRMDFIQQNGVSMLCQALKKLQDEIGVWENVEINDDVDDLKNKMVDEFHCIMCIKFATRDADGCRGALQLDSGNLEVICQSLLSPCMQSRIAVMDLLANLIHKNPTTALRPVLQQFTTLRLRYAQHDRFRFLVGMSQTNGKLNLLFKASLLNMMNEMLKACPSGNYQVYLQTELEEAGLNVDEVEKTAKALAYKDEAYEDAANVVRQVTLWRENYIMVDKPRRISASAISANTVESPSPSLPTYEYGSACGTALSQRSGSNAVALTPQPFPILPRPPPSPGEIKVVIKSVSPLQEAEYANRMVSIGAAEIHPPPIPPPPPNYKPPLRPHTYSQNPMHRQKSDGPTVSDIYLREEAAQKRAEKSTFTHRSLTEVPAKFGVASRKMQNTNLNQRMADKFSSEYNDWRRKRSGDSVDSVDSSDSTESSPDCRGAVYLVDGVYPAQKTMIDDVLLQFDRAYDALDEQLPNKR